MTACLPLALALAASACATVLGLDDFGGDGTGTAAGTSSASSTGGAGGQGGATPTCTQADASYWDRFEHDWAGQGWGSADSGDTYNYTEAAWFFVAGEQGQLDANQTRHVAWPSVLLGDLELVGMVAWPTPATGFVWLDAGFQFRRSDSQNYYEAIFEHRPSLNVILRLREVADGTQTELTALDMGGNFSAAGYRVHLRASGTSPMHWSVRAWPANGDEYGLGTRGASGSLDEPKGPQTGFVAMRASRVSATPMVVSFDEIYLCPYPR